MEFQSSALSNTMSTFSTNRHCNRYLRYMHCNVEFFTFFTVTSCWAKTSDSEESLLSDVELAAQYAILIQ